MDKVHKELVTVLFSLLMILKACLSSDKGICVQNGIEYHSIKELVSVAEICNFTIEIDDIYDPNCLIRVSLDDILCMQHDFTTNTSIAAVLERGIHTPSLTIDGHLHIANQNNLTLSGDGDKESVVLKRINLILSDIKNTNLNNFTAEESSLNVYGTSDVYSRTTIIVENCTMINSLVILTDVSLFVKNCEIKNCTHSAVISYSSFIIFAGIVEFSSNTGETGGALNLRGSRIKIVENASVMFRNNSASEFGGAIFVDNADLYISSEGYNSFCFYSIEQVDSNYSLKFIENVAEKGGDHIYGASLKSSCTAAFRSEVCDKISTCGWPSYEISNSPRGNFKFQPSLNALSAISSKPTRVCLCSSSHEPQCSDIDLIFNELHTYPGEHFTIPIVIVGGDFGTTVGTVYAHFNSTILQQCRHFSKITREQVITENKVCTNLSYCFYGSEYSSTVNVYLITNTKQRGAFTTSRQTVVSAIEKYKTDRVIHQTLFNTPVVLNITFLPCPPGFFLLENPLRCDCHPDFENIHCTLKNGNGYISWNSTRWIDTINSSKGTGIITTKRCPFGYCKRIKINIDIQYNPDTQCKFNRAGKLCGRCKDNYSLAIGSSHCIQCPNNNNLALLLFFAAIGPLLVIVISTLNLTVTQGTVNWLIFYANVVWAYQSVFFPSTEKYKVLLVLKPFIAWLNLDFGIEACFYQGLDMFSKTWIQFIFPVYTATLFFIGLKFSSRFSNLLGNRSVPTLATLLALSFNKLLCIIIAGLQLAQIKTYTSKIKSTSVSIVWALDGNFEYGKYPHIFLLVAVLACLIFLWIPYTLILFSMQWLRRIDHYRPLKPIAKYKPVYDAYFAPFKDTHHYWFGVLLLAQGALLLISSLLLSIYPTLNLLLLCSTVILMLCYLNFMRIYKRNVTILMESSFYINLILLTAGMLHLEQETIEQEILLSLSIGIAFLTFCAIIAWNLISWKLKKYCNKAERSLWLFQMESIDMIKDESDTYDKGYIRYRDSVLN
jgi:predicted outer membrane repeat protein